MILFGRVETYHNELYETTEVQDIPAGAIILQIDIQGVDKLETFVQTSKHKERIVKEDKIFYCRFLCTDSMDALIPIDVNDIWKRSIRYSSFHHVYSINLPTHEESDTRKDPYSTAIAQLHVSYIPESMPCRQEEHKRIMDFITRQFRGPQSKRQRSEKGKAKKGKDSTEETINVRPISGIGPLYLSGMTGTGKTATVLTAISSLSQIKEELGLPDYTFIEINGLRLSSPQEAYTLLWKGISGEHVASRTALQRLKDYFAEKKNINSDSFDEIEHFICLLDELDFLITSNEAVIYNLLEWSQSQNSGLILIGIANTMDLPDRLSKKSQSRMGGGTFHRISFRPYTFDQILQILTNRLQNLNGIFDGKILELVARKAAACSGDLRSALKICQRYRIQLFFSYY